MIKNITLIGFMFFIVSAEAHELRSEKFDYEEYLECVEFSHRFSKRNIIEALEPVLSGRVPVSQLDETMKYAISHHPTVIQDMVFAHKLPSALNVLSEILDIEGININQSFRWFSFDAEKSPIFYASELNLPDFVKLFLEKGADAEKGTECGETPLMLASRSDFEKVVRVLLEYGVQVNKQSKKGTTALMNACRIGSESIVSMLLAKGAKVEIKDDKGETALSYAKSYPEIKKILFEYGAVEDISQVSSATLPEEKVKKKNKLFFTSKK